MNAVRFVDGVNTLIEQRIQVIPNNCCVLRLVCVDDLNKWISATVVVCRRQVSGLPHKHSYFHVWRSFRDLLAPTRVVLPVDLPVFGHIVDGQLDSDHACFVMQFALADRQVWFQLDPAKSRIRVCKLHYVASPEANPLIAANLFLEI